MGIPADIKAASQEPPLAQSNLSQALTAPSLSPPDVPENKQLLLHRHMQASWHQNRIRAADEQT